MNLTAKAVGAKSGQITGMVDMGMSKKYLFNFFRRDWERLSIAQTIFLFSLKKTTINEYFVLVNFQKTFGPGNGSRCAQKS